MSDKQEKKKDEKSLLKISQLQVQSFITELDEKERKHVRGGHVECDPYTGSTPC